MHSYHTQLQNSPQPTDIKPRPQHLSSSSALSSPSLILRSTERSKFPSRCEVYKALFFLHDNLVQNSPTEQGRKHLPKHVSMITDAKNETHMGSAGKPQAAREHSRETSGSPGAQAKENTGGRQGGPAGTRVLPSSRSSRVCLGSRCPEHLPTNCPPRTRAAGPSQGGRGGAGRLGGNTQAVDSTFPKQSVGQVSEQRRKRFVCLQ